LTAPEHSSNIRAFANVPNVTEAPCELQGGPSRKLGNLGLDEVSAAKEQVRLAQKELRQAQKNAAKAEAARKHSEKKRKLAEAHAARAQCAAYYDEAEIQAAREAQHSAESALRKNTLATFTALNKLSSITLPPTENKPIAGPACVLCLDAPAEVMAYPCGHRCYCDICAKGARTDLVTASIEQRCMRCPVCREALENLVRVF